MLLLNGPLVNKLHQYIRQIEAGQVVRRNTFIPPQHGRHNCMLGSSFSYGVQRLFTVVILLVTPTSESGLHKSTVVISSINGDWIPQAIGSGLCKD